MIRDLTDRDYGIDGVNECFNGDSITGKLALVQLKGTGDYIKPLKTKPVISCQISTSSAYYAMQDNIPVILIYASLKNKESFYYIFLQEVEFDTNKLETQDKITVHIPVKNKISDNLDCLKSLIEKYYK